MHTDPPPKRNFLEVDENQPLWRVFSHMRLAELFDTRQLVLVEPAMWEDPFENFLSRCEVKIGTEKASLGGLTEGFYGQCWTDRADETDATWRIYAPANERGVRVKVKASNLFDCIYDSNRQESALECFLGKVVYQSEGELRRWLESLSVGTQLLDPTNEQIARTLLIKRDPFAHESEVRLLFQDLDHKSKPRIAKFDCEPTRLVEHILLDPRWTTSEASTFQNIIRCLGYAGPIEHSSLFRIPNFPTLSL
jgi:hypothetical protein